ncbi:MAG: putative ADP-ribose binding module [Polyangiaceae bacterium]|jgi:O-acetyl-ADP-ribose deacetylase (regulator of RNase III)|nr:putative ADP-ribose binding module [Polyangiaceae bacterium]
MGELRVVPGDVTRLRADVIVNAANERLLGGGGVDGAIHAAAGPGLLAACRALPEVRPGVRCPTGEARITPAFDLPARWVVHTVGPVWRGGTQGEGFLLASCYRASLALARAHGARSVAFPAISTGIYGFPRYLASRIAAYECATALMSAAVAEGAPDFELISLVAFSEPDAAQLREAVAERTRPAARRQDGATQALPSNHAVLGAEVFDRTYTPVQWAWLKKGVVPREMEDKWFVFYEAPWLYLHRSWTSHAIFQARFEERATGAALVEALVNRDPAQYSEPDLAAAGRYLLGLLDGWASR